MSVINLIKQLFIKEKITIKEKPTCPDGYLPLQTLYGERYKNIYINKEGMLFDKSLCVYKPTNRYTRICNFYHYIPKMILEVFTNEKVENIHEVHFQDYDRNNFSLKNIHKINTYNLGYFVINSYTQDIQYNVKGTLKDEEYIVYEKDLLDHNWSVVYKEWYENSHIKSSSKRLVMAEVIVDIQDRTLQFKLAKRGTPLAQPIKNKIVYKIICDNLCKDFWIIKPKGKSDIRHLTRFITSYKLNAMQ